METKIAICGSKAFDEHREQTERENCRVIGRGISQIASDLGSIVLATGGTAGLPAEIVSAIREYCTGETYELTVQAYTFLKPQDVWEQWLEKGIAPKDLFDEIIFPEDPGQELVERAIRRMNPLLKDSDATVFYLNPKSRHTYEEIRKAQNMRIPQFVMVDDPTVMTKAEEDGGNLTRLYNDPERLSHELHASLI